MVRTLYVRVTTLKNLFVYGLGASGDWTGAEMWGLNEESDRSGQRVLYHLKFAARTPPQAPLQFGELMMRSPRLLSRLRRGKPPSHTSLPPRLDSRAAALVTRRLWRPCPRSRTFDVRQSAIPHCF